MQRDASLPGTGCDFPGPRYSLYGNASHFSIHKSPLNQAGKLIFAVREAGISRHNGGPVKGPLLKLYEGGLSAVMYGRF